MGEHFDEAKLQAMNVGDFVFCAQGDAAFRDEQGRDDGAGSRRVALYGEPVRSATARR
jgi:hypothetical protein